jgi:hypothetical protein
MNFRTDSAVRIGGESERAVSQKTRGETTMTRKIAAAVVLSAALVSLGACVSPEEIRAQDMAVCAGYGFQQGTPDFANCMQRESLVRRTYLYAPDPFYGPYGAYGPYGSGGSANIFFGF